MVALSAGSHRSTASRRHAPGRCCRRRRCERVAAYRFRRSLWTSRPAILRSRGRRASKVSSFSTRPSTRAGGRRRARAPIDYGPRPRCRRGRPTMALRAGNPEWPARASALDRDSRVRSPTLDADATGRCVGRGAQSIACARVASTWRRRSSSCRADSIPPSSVAAATSIGSPIATATLDHGLGTCVRSQLFTVQ